jgi:hypothetical protein
MSIGTSVPNLISYLHEFFQNFYQSPTIYFELISFGVIFNPEIADKRAPLVSRRALRRASRPLARLPTASRRRPESRLASAAAAPTGRVRAPAVRAVPSPLPPPRAPARRPSHHVTVSAPVSRRLPAVSVRPRRAVARRRAAPPRALPAEAVGRVAAGRVSAAHTSRACAVRVGRANAAAWAMRTVRLGRERFWPSAPGLILLISDLFNSLQIQKFV